MTSLIYASQEGHLDVVFELLKNGADINAKNENGKFRYVCEIWS